MPKLYVTLTTSKLKGENTNKRKLFVSYLILLPSSKITKS